ncbi:MAG: hypothetical protein LBV67_06180, partial [Streptococcaceae bacterium]|nr:hypothetical protein [Streptococcaceae bacterium]
MFIRRLKILNTVTDTIIRDVPFHLGANFVVDLEDSSKHNKVGKTTFLKLIDVALGAKERSHIYTDLETNSSVQKLDDFISDNKVAIELYVGDEIEKPNKSHILYVELFKSGKYEIDGKRYTQPEYRNELNSIFFHNDKTPTFRQLIGSFVRISLAGDNDTFLRNLTRASYSAYRGVYNYLFNISDPTID